AMTPRTTVTGRRRVSSTRTDWRVQSDSPRFPRPIAPSQSTYCTWIGRSSPSFALRSSRSLPYAFSSSMSWTTSPGIRRGRVNTMSEAISSDGTATRRRRRTYLRMRPLAGHEPAIEVRLGVGPGAAQSDEHLVELSEDRARDERAVLPQLQLGVDAGGLPVLEGDLHEIIKVGPVPGPGRLHRGLEPVRVAGLGQ